MTRKLSALGDDLVTDEARGDALAMIDVLRSLADGFYRRAVQIGVHSFIEHAGLMREHIKVLERGVAEGMDPRSISVHQKHLPAKMKSYEGDYLAEKFCCIFIPILGRDGWEAFKRHVEHEVKQSEPSEPSEVPSVPDAESVGRMWGLLEAAEICDDEIAHAREQQAKTNEGPGGWYHGRRDVLQRTANRIRGLRSRVPGGATK